MPQRPRPTDPWNSAAREGLDPAWLAPDAPESDICLSSRVRVMRNLQGHLFPHRAETAELREIAKKVITASELHPPAIGVTGGWTVLRGLSPSERESLLMQRLISPELRTDLEGRAVLLNPAKSISVMVNEEDHLRFQGLTAGWSLDAARRSATDVADRFADAIPYAWSPRFGYLSASPYNAGDGVRMSAMFHLIGLAQTKRLGKVLEALNAQDVTARGLFGESSRAIGAFLQVSVSRLDPAAIQGAGDYLIAQERAARDAISDADLAAKAEEAKVFAVASRSLSLADALRVLGWLRFAATRRAAGSPVSPRVVDGWLTQLEFRVGQDPHQAGKDRAVAIREWVESL